MIKSKAIPMAMKTDDLLPFLKYDGQDSFFQGSLPLAEGFGYAIVVGFGLLFSGITVEYYLLAKRPL